jgi:hypothetical protein
VLFNVNGTHLMIPLSAIYFDSNGVLKADLWPLFATYQASVVPLLQRLRDEGVLSPGQQAVAKPAFTATAITAGTVATLEITTANVVPDSATPANSKADFTVTETDLYTALEPATLKATLGETAGAGKRPGLVFVSSVAAPALPKNGSYAAVAAAPGDPGAIKVPKNSGAGDAFELETRDVGADAILTSVDIKDTDAVAGKFTLVAKWSKTAPALAVSGVGAAFAYVITVTAPPDGFLAPGAGKVVLAGGADAIAVNPVKASATVLAQ